MRKNRKDVGVWYVLGLTAAGLVLTCVGAAIGLDGWAGTLAVSVPFLALVFWLRSRLMRDKE